MKYISIIPIIIILLCISSTTATSQDYQQYLEWFQQDVTTFNTQLSSSMARRLPIMTNLGSVDSSTNMGGHIFTVGIGIGSALTPDFYNSLTQGATYHLIDVNTTMGIKKDLNYLYLPAFNIYGKIRATSNWAFSGRINYLPSFERENFHFKAFTLNLALNRSLIKIGDFAGVSIAPFFTYANGSTTYSPKKIMLPFSVLGEDFRLESQLDINLDWNLYSFGAEGKVSVNLLFFHPFGGAVVYTNAGNTEVSTNPTVEVWMVDPPTKLIHTTLDMGKVKGSPESFQTNIFGGFEISAGLVKLGLRIDYEVMSSSFAAQLGIRILI